jgi:hypothetical protein
VVFGKRDVDENGRVSLAGLAPDARRIIETAHGFAQQRGAIRISHRFLLAAFPQKPTGQFETICRRQRGRARACCRIVACRGLGLAGPRGPGAEGADTDGALHTPDETSGCDRHPADQRGHGVT